ncbi:histidine phosphatase family protein [Methylocapsa sp. S129]|uniref:histidine phosphatase family protein n=1 Tax=Methylocapsa sp. S129 TaxID=1641869 RepID=UPI001FEFAEEC|nr:histidine phosphatase family protein [Methylocapsa sp. S129]
MNPARKASLRLTLIRHGETEWSLSGQHTGRTDIALTARGEDGARALEPCLRGIAFARVLTSPRARAQRTAVLAGLGAAAEIEPDLAEWDYGDYEGLRSADIHKERPGWNIFRDGCPHGETPAEVADRADRLLARLRAEGGEIALFTHGHFGRVLAARWIGAPVIMGERFTLGVASLSVLGFEPSHPETSTVVLWNFDPSNEPGSARCK